MSPAPTPGWPAPSVRVEPRRLAPGEEGWIVITLAVPDGCHVQSHMPREPFLIPTTVQLDASDVLELGPVVYPAGDVDRFEWTPVELEVYRGTVEIVVPVGAAAGGAVVPGDRGAGPGHTRARIAGRLRYQGCTESACLPPVEQPFEAWVDVVAPPPARTTDRGTAHLAAVVVPPPARTAERGVGGLADDVAAHGIAAIADRLPAFLADARARGVTPLLLDLLADTREPDVVRERALGRALVELDDERSDHADAVNEVAAA